MPDPFVSAKTELRERHQRANWSKLLLRPIYLNDGTALNTLKDAAVRILELPPAPPSRTAAQRIIDSAMGDGDLIATEIAVRLGPPSAHSDRSGWPKSALHLSHRGQVG